MNKTFCQNKTFCHELIFIKYKTRITQNGAGAIPNEITMRCFGAMFPQVKKQVLIKYLAVAFRRGSPSFSPDLNETFATSSKTIPMSWKSL